MPPTRFIDKNAESVLEIRDVGLLVRARQSVRKRLGQVVTPAQLRSLVHELELSLGFDPTTLDGLRSAGLKQNGTIVVQTVDGGRGALWVIPVAEVEAFDKAIERVVRARTPVDEVQPYAAAGRKGRRFITQFGRKMAVVAVVVVERGYGLIGVGSNAEALVSRALEIAQTEAMSMAAAPAYGRLVADLGDAWELRLIAPDGRRVLSDVLQRAGSLTDVADISRLDLSTVRSVGGVVDFKGAQASVRGRIMLTDRGQELTGQVLQAPAAGRGAVEVVDVPDAVIYIQAAGSPAGLLGALAPPGSAFGRRVDRFFTRVNQETEVDVRKDVIPNLSGHAALGFGLGELTDVSFGQLAHDPTATMWAVAAFGVRDPELPERLSAGAEPKLKKRKLTFRRRSVGQHAVRGIVSDLRDSDPFLETFAIDRTWILSSQPQMTNLILSRLGKTDAGHVSPGIMAQLRFRPLSEQLKRLSYGDVPLLYRSILTKLVDLTRLLDRGELRVTSAVDGIAVDAQLSLVVPGGDDS